MADGHQHDQSELSRLADRAHQLVSGNQFDEAIQCVEPALSEARRELGEQAAVGRLALVLAEAYSGLRQFDRSEPLYRETLAITRRIYGESSLEAARSLNTLGWVLRQRGKLEEAREAYEAALEIRRALLGDDHPDVATLHNNLGALCHSEGAFDAALAHYEAALEIQRRLPDVDELAVARTRSNRAMANYEREEEHAAETELRDVLRIRRQHLGDQSPSVASTLRNLALIVSGRGEREEGETLNREARAIYVEALGEHHPDVEATSAELESILSAPAVPPLFVEAMTAITALSLSRQFERTVPELLRIRARLLSLVGKEHPVFLKVERAVVEFGPLAKHESAAEAWRLNREGLSKVEQGEDRAAEELFARAVELNELALGPDHVQTGWTIANWAHRLSILGEYVTAHTLYEKARAIFRKERKLFERDYAQVLHNFGGHCIRAAHFDLAGPLFEEALAIRTRLLGDNHYDVANTLSSWGGLCENMGDYTAAEKLHRQALGIHSRRGTGESLAGARCHGNLGEALRLAGRFGEALEHLTRSLEIRRRVMGERHPSVTTALNNLGLLHFDIGDLERSEQLLARVAELRRSRHGKGGPARTAALQNLAAVKNARGKFEEAADLLNEVLDVQGQEESGPHPDKANVLNSAGLILLDSGRADEAVKLLEQALDIWRKTCGHEHPATAAGLNNVAVARRALGQNEEAARLHNDALRIRRAIYHGAHFDVVESLNNLAAAEVALSRERDALQHLIEAFDFEDELIADIFCVTSERQRLALMARVYARFESLVSLLLRPGLQSPENVRLAFEGTLLRKGLVTDASAVQRAAILSGKNPELAAKWQALAALRSQIGQLRQSPAPPRDTDKRIREWQTRAEELEQEMAAALPGITERYRRRVYTQELANALPQDTALVELLQLRPDDFEPVGSRLPDARYLAFVLRNSGLVELVAVDLGPSAQIDGLVKVFRQSVDQPARDVERKPAADPAESEAGVSLRTAVYDPLADALEGCNRLVIAPDGNLALLPFETLPLGDGRRIIDACQVSYLTTARDILGKDRPQKAKPGPSVVACDPDFDLSADVASDEPKISDTARPAAQTWLSGIRFNRLPGARLEGLEVARLLDTEPLVGEAVLEARIKRIRSPRILHLATHGYFLESPPGTQRRNEGSAYQDRQLAQAMQPARDNPLLRSGLALAGANTWLAGGQLPDDAEDGLLNAEDVSGIDLSETDLVVLSACDTGLGKVLVGESVFGLRRAFALAGARVLIVSLWKVPDEATRELMLEFYRGLLGGHPVGRALRDAQLRLKEKYPAPGYWGAFVCQGDAELCMRR